MKAVDQMDWHEDLDPESFLEVELGSGIEVEGHVCEKCNNEYRCPPLNGSMKVKSKYLPGRGRAMLKYTCLAGILMSSRWRT
jgi:hypothetical protein